MSAPTTWPPTYSGPSSSAVPASGARIVTTLLHEMRRHSAVTGRAAKGAASMCIGVGQGIATLWEAC